MYGREFDGYLFEDAVEETDELLDGKTAARVKKIEVDKDLDERSEGFITFFVVVEYYWQKLQHKGEV